MRRDKKAAILDLFDQGSDSQPGERQTDIEEVIFEKSLAGLIMAGDDDGVEDWQARAKSGEIMRIM